MMLDEFERWLKFEKGYSYSSVTNYIRKLRSLMRIGVESFDELEELLWSRGYKPVTRTGYRKAMKLWVEFNGGGCE